MLKCIPYFFVLILIMTISTHVCAYEPQTEKEIRIEKAGDILQVLIPASGYIATFVLDDEEGRKQFYKSFFVNILVTHALKNAIQTTRPENNGEESFPSGHTSTAFQGATFIHRRYGWKYSIPAYIGAVFVGYSRDEGDQHHLIDIFAGAAIGILSSYYFTSPYKDLEVIPTVNSNIIGLKITYKW